MMDNEEVGIDTTQAETLNFFSAEKLLAGSAVLDQVRGLRDDLSRGSDGTIVDYDDMFFRIQTEVDNLPALELQMSVPSGSEGAYQRQLLQALDQINGDHDRVLRKVIKLKSRMLEAISLMNNKRAQFAAFYTMAIPVAVKLSQVPKLKVTAAHAKEMAAAEFSKLVDRMDDFAPSMVNELSILELEIKLRKKTQSDKYQLGKDQVNAMWDSIQSPGAVGLDDDPNSLLRRIEVEDDEEMPSFVSKHSKEVRVSASPSYLRPLSTLCSVRGEKQHSTTSGDTCPNGHGGAAPMDDIKGTFFKRGDAKPLNVIVRDDGEVETVVELPDEDNGAEELNVAQGYDNLDELYKGIEEPNAGNINDFINSLASKTIKSSVSNEPTTMIELEDVELPLLEALEPEPARIISADALESILNTSDTISTPAPATPRKKLILLDDEDII